MKRFLALFTATLILVANFFTYIPSQAASSVDYGEMLNIYLGAAETALAASQGANIDWSNIEYPEEASNWTAQQKAQYVVSYIGAYKKLGAQAIYDWLFPDDPNYTGSVISAETAAIGLNTNSNINTLDIKSQLDNILATQSNAHVFQTYSNKVIARWNEYNTNYINKYLEKMNYIDAQIPTPDSYYVQYINQINNTNATWINGSNPNPAYPGYYWISPMNAISLFRRDPSNDLNSIGFSSGMASSLLDLRIYSIDENTYTFYCQPPKVPVFGGPNDNRNSYNSFNTSYPNGGLFQNNGYFDTPLFSKTGTLEDVFKYIRANFQNVNIYVDNQPWVLPNSVFEPDVAFSIPDAVIDSSSDDGKIVAHPIYYPDAVNTDGAINIDLDKVIDAIASKIANGADDITFEDMVNAGAAVKLDGTTLTDADTATADVSVPIEAAKVGDLVVPLEVVPPLPNLPPIIPPGGDSGNVPNGFAGMSVLARIINVTVQSVPTPLIMAFFGVIFGMIILGIIKILHH